VARRTHRRRHRREAEPAADDRGRDARRPAEIPARGWRDIAWRVWSEMTEDNLSIAAAGVAFYALLAIFPALTALVSIYGLVADPAQVQQHLASLSGMLPPEAYQIIDDQITSVVSSADSSLSFGVVFGLALSVWSATKGMTAVMAALNMAYDEEERRGMIRYYLTAILLTLGGVVGVILALFVIVAIPAILELVGLDRIFKGLISVLRWPLLAVFLLIGLAAIYRYGPSRETAQWRWISWGAIFVTVLFIVGSLLFSWYVANFGNYNETYGSLGAVIGLLMWFWLTSYFVLIGAEVNAEIEHQTAVDSTTGAPQPMGARGAYVADTVGKSP
jgi:membrane protein